MNTGSTYVHVTADGQALATPGVLRRIVLNGLTTAGDCIVYDNTVTGGANVVAVLHLDLTTSVSVQPVTFEYNVRLNTGLYLEFDATLVADLTVVVD